MGVRRTLRIAAISSAAVIGVGAACGFLLLGMQYDKENDARWEQAQRDAVAAVREAFDGTELSVAALSDEQVFALAVEGCGTDFVLAMWSAERDETGSLLFSGAHWSNDTGDDAEDPRPDLDVPLEYRPREGTPEELRAGQVRDAQLDAVRRVVPPTGLCEGPSGSTEDPWGS